MIKIVLVGAGENGGCDFMRQAFLIGKIEE
jgi:hypothetical protein